MESVESDSPSLGDNIGESPHWVEPEATDSGLRNHRPFTRLLSKQYHKDTTIVNDVVTSRVRKRTFGRASCFRFDTALLRTHGPRDFVKNFSKRVAGWLTAGIGPV